MRSNAFTLVELLVVLAILSILASILAGGFRSSQARGRDAERKSDLKQIANALELYYSDYNKYPDTQNGQIVGCSGAPCAWGSGEFTDGKTIYFKTVPKDPAANLNYYYRIMDSGQKFQLYARLENSQDKNCLLGAAGGPDCTNPSDVPEGVSCSSNNSNVCNFSITSTNTTPTETVTE